MTMVVKLCLKVKLFQQLYGVRIPVLRSSCIRGSLNQTGALYQLYLTAPWMPHGSKWEYNGALGVKWIHQALKYLTFVLLKEEAGFVVLKGALTAIVET